MSIIAIVVCSTREGRFSEKVAAWINAELSARQNTPVKLLDLRDFPLPFFDQPCRRARQGGNVMGIPMTMIDDLLWWTASLKGARLEGR